MTQLRHMLARTTTTAVENVNLWSTSRNPRETPLDTSQLLEWYICIGHVARLLKDPFGRGPRRNGSPSRLAMSLLSFLSSRRSLLSSVRS